MFRTTTSTTAAAAAAALLSGALVAGTTATAAASPTYHPWGTTSSKDHVLKQGCHSYPYSYRITAPSDDWAAEIFLVNPNGRALASAAVLSESDPEAGTLRFRLCRASTVFGRHKIKMKVTWQRDRETTDGWVAPSTFRFKRP